MSDNNSAVNYKNPKSLGNQFRQKRFLFFQALIEDLPRPLKILDIGGTVSFWKNRGLADHDDYEITIINLEKEDHDCSNIKSEVGDATNLSHYPDKCFDVIFSNSVIEHLYTKENQVAMANEVMRLGKNYFVQTPNKYFPIEPHFVFPVFQFLPRSVKIFLMTKTRLVKRKKHEYNYVVRRIEEIRLLSKKSLKKMFPGSEIFSERFLLVNKSFIVHNAPFKI